LVISDLNFKRIKFSIETTDRFQIFKRNTDLTPNIAARFALILSLAQDNIPSEILYSGKDGQEINRDTFLGDLGSFLLSSFVIWCNENNIKKEDSYKYLILHINRGSDLLTNRVKSLGDLGNIISY